MAVEVRRQAPSNYDIIERSAIFKPNPDVVSGNGPRAVHLLGRARRALLLTLLAVTPLLVAPSFTLDQYNMPKLALLMVGVPLAAAIRCLETMLAKSAFRWRDLFWPALAGTSSMLIAWAASPHQAWSLWGQSTRLQGLLPYLVVIAFGLLLLDAFYESALPLAWAVAASGAAAGAVATYQMLFAGAAIASISTSGYVTSTLGHSNFAGGFLAIALPISVMLWLRGGPGRWPAIVCAAVIADGLLFTFSQGGWLAAVAGIVVAVGINASSSKPRFTAIGLAVAGTLVAGSVALVVVSASAPGLVERFTGLASAQTRGLLWTQATDLFLERPLTGWGPNTFALEAPSRRGVQEALAAGTFFGDDPHSVPLSMAANAGIFGVAGIGVLLLWPIVRWRGAARSGHIRDRALAAGFAGGLAAYLAQAVVSLDEIALRLELWACLAGFAAVTAGPLVSRYQASRMRIFAGAPIFIAAVAIALWAAATLVPADHLALQGARAIRRGQVRSGSGEIERAISLRDAFEYRHAWAAALGDTAIERREQGGLLIREMRKQYANLRRRGDPHAARDEARYLFSWSPFDPTLEQQALSLYRTAANKNPYDPVLAVQMADVLVSMERYREALSVLRRFVPLLTERYPAYALTRTNQQFWGALAVSEALGGDPSAARRAIVNSHAAGGDDCRTWIAEELLKPPPERRQRPGIGFLCPEILLRLLPPTTDSDGVILPVNDRGHAEEASSRRQK